MRHLVFHLSSAWVSSECNFSFTNCNVLAYDGVTTHSWQYLFSPPTGYCCCIPVLLLKSLCQNLTQSSLFHNHRPTSFFRWLPSAHTFFHIFGPGNPTVWYVHQAYMNLGKPRFDIPISTWHPSLSRYWERM